jgi:site-specific recombinase XerD
MARVTKEDFEPTDEQMSLRDMVREEVFGYSQEGKDGQWYPRLPDESLDDIMKRVYNRIEKEALEVYHSNEAWALRQWILNHILKEEVGNEINTQIADELLDPVFQWQSQSYDPVSKYKQKLIADGKPAHSITTCMKPISKFVARKGRKANYSDDEIIEHISHLRKDGFIKKDVNKETGETTWKRTMYKPTTLYHEVVQLKQFFTFLHGRNWNMPVKMPEVPNPEDMYQPMLSDEQVETLIFSTLIDKVPASWVVRLAASTLYGCRASELADIATKDIYLDGENSSIYIQTRKKGIKKRQPIPVNLLPIFAIPVEPLKTWRLRYIFMSICKKAELNLPSRAGWHSLRRRVVTDIYQKTQAKEIPIINYFRWSNKQRNLGQLPTYVKVPIEVTDKEILSAHPIVKVWETVVPYLVKLHPEYSTNPNVVKSYNEII